MKKIALLMLSLVASNVMAGPSILERTRNRFRSEADRCVFYDTKGNGKTCEQVLASPFISGEWDSACTEKFYATYLECADKNPAATSEGIYNTLANHRIVNFYILNELTKKGYVPADWIVALSNKYLPECLRDAIAKGGKVQITVGPAI